VRTPLRLVLSILFALSGLLVVAGCRTASDGLTVDDPYVKAAAAGEMTSVFGRLVNSGPDDLTVVSASSDAAESVELHEMVMADGAMVMREKPDGFVVPAGETVELEPGGLHVMLIGLSGDIEPGAQVTVTLTLSDGTEVELTAQAREMANAQESYHT